MVVADGDLMPVVVDLSVVVDDGGVQSRWSIVAADGCSCGGGDHSGGERW